MATKKKASAAKPATGNRKPETDPYDILLEEKLAAGLPRATAEEAVKNQREFDQSQNPKS